MDNYHFTENQRASNVSSMAHEQEDTTREKKNIIYPKNAHGLVNHWGAIVDHVSNVDKTQKSIEKLNRSIDATQLERTLNGQIIDKTQRNIEAREKEKEFEIKMINESQGKYKKEETDRRNYKEKLKTFLSSEYDKQIEKKQNHVRIKNSNRNYSKPNSKNLNISNRIENEIPQTSPNENYNNNQLLRNEFNLNIHTNNDRYSSKSNSTVQEKFHIGLPIKKKSTVISHNDFGPIQNTNKNFYEEVSRNNTNNRHARYKRDNQRLGNFSLDGRLCKSFDINDLANRNGEKSPGNSPLGELFNEHYNYLNRRNESLKCYAKDLTNVIESNRKTKLSNRMLNSNNEKSDRIKNETEYQEILKYHYMRKTQNTVKYKQELDHQVVQQNMNRNFKLKMTKNEKLLNKNNLNAYKNDEYNLYSAVPGWGNNAHIQNHNLFQKLKKKDSKT